MSGSKKKRGFCGGYHHSGIVRIYKATFYCTGLLSLSKQLAAAHVGDIFKPFSMKFLASAMSCACIGMLKVTLFSSNPRKAPSKILRMDKD